MKNKTHNYSKYIQREYTVIQIYTKSYDQTSVRIYFTLIHSDAEG